MAEASPPTEVTSDVEVGLDDSDGSEHEPQATTSCGDAGKVMRLRC